MSAPFVWILAFFVSGILCARYVLVTPWILVPATIAPFFALKYSSFRISAAVNLVWVFFLTIALTQLQEQKYERNELRSWVAQNEKEVVSFTGVLIRTPELADQYFVIQVDVESISGRTVKGIARLTVSGELTTELVRGDRIESFGRFRIPRNFQTDGAFDYEQYLRTQKIHVLGTIKNEGLIHRTGKARSLKASISRLRLKWIRNTMHAYSEAASGILRALWLDDRGGLSQAQERALIDAGVFHVIAISGFHISVLLLLLFLLFKRIVSFRSAMAAACLFLLAYFLILEGRSSVTRSFLSFLIVAFAIWRYEQIRLANWIALSALIQLMLNPNELYDVGFQLTYLSTCAILFLVVPVSKILQRLPALYRYPLNFLLAGFIVQAVLIPYQIYIFHRIALYSLVANIIAVPVSSVLIGVSGMLMPAPLIAKLLRVPVQMALTGFMDFVSLAADFGVRIVPSPPLILVFLFYGTLLLFIVVRSKKWKILSLSFSTIVFAAILNPRPPVQTGALRLHFLDVGQGDAILIEYPDATFDLVDGGGFFNSDALDTGQAILLPYLARLRVSNLERVFLTHAHADHMNGLVSLMRYMPVSEFCITRQPVGEKSYQHFLRNINRAPTRLSRGTNYHRAGVQITVLAPEDSDTTNRVRNDDSLVLLLEYRGSKVLLTGDVERYGEEVIVSKLRGHVDYMKVPHHGSKTSSSSILLNAVRPRVAFISVGHLNWFGHPHPDVLKRYRESHVSIFRTDVHGTIVLDIGKGTPRIVLRE